MNQNYKLIPIDKQYKGAPLVDTILNINLEGTNRELIEGDISVPLNLSERFNNERQNFSLYRVYGKLQPIVFMVNYNHILKMLILEPQTKHSLI
jgi:hypothetical protein